MTFYVGQKVVCIKKDAWQHSRTGNGLSRGEIAPSYGDVLHIRTIKEVGDNVYLRFNEIKNPKLKYKTGLGEIQFNSVNFRPAVTRSTETGMAILRGLLDTSPVSLNEEVG